jgi:transcriptional regulator with XRE-family HTH domain
MSQFAALGNFIKASRKKLSLTKTQLAERIGVSNQMVTMLEQGKRGGSRATLQKLADVLQVDVQVLLQLRHIKNDEQELDEVVTKPLIVEEQDIYELLEQLKSVKPEIRLRLLPEFKNKIVELQKHYLRPYELAEVKRAVLDIKNYWLNMVQGKKEPLDFEPTPEMEGYIQRENRDVYFRTIFQDKSLELILSYNDKMNLDDFEMWLGQSSLYIIEDEMLPTMTLEVKVIHAIWFCPMYNLAEMYQYVVRNGWLEKNPTFHDTKLEWYFRQHYIFYENGVQLGDEEAL